MATFIFDGPDGSGKTTLAKRISKELNLPYHKNPYEHSEWKHPERYKLMLRYTDLYFLTYLKNSGSDVVLDRCWTTEWVYSQVFNRGFDESFLKELDELTLQVPDSVVIITTRTSQPKESDELEGVDENWKKIRDKYFDLASWTKNKVIYINTENRTPDETYVYCLEQLKEKGLLK